MERRLVLSMLLMGCGSVGSSDGNDAAAPPDDAAPADAPIDAPDVARCSPDGVFGTPAPVAELNSEGTRNDMARLSPDELTVYFASNRPGTQGEFDIYIARRESRDVPFGAPALLAGVNTAGAETSPTTTGDELTIYTLGNGGSDIFVAARSSTDAPFDALVGLDSVNTADQETEPYVLPDNSAIYFPRSEVGAGTSFDLFRAARNGDLFDTPERVEGINLNSANVDALPVVSADELTLFFASDRPIGDGLFNIFVTTRPDRATAFGDPVELTELNSSDRDQPTWISPDGCVLYLSRHTATTMEILVSTRGM